jgi:CRP-like cAMP-binding protein
MNIILPGLKKLLISPRPHPVAADVDAARARALFEAEEIAGTKRARSLADFLGQVSLFQDLGHRDLARLARIVHEREYADGEYVCEEGRPGAALFIVRRGVVEVVRRGAGDDVRLALLEPPASFEEPAVIGIGAPRWLSVRARGPVSLLALGKSDLDALSVDFPVMANKVLMRLAGLMAARLRMLVDTEFLGESDERAEGRP